jgi:integrase
MARDLLSELKVRQAKPSQRPYKLHDGGGLYLHVHPNGSKYWRKKFRYVGKERVFAIGVYPDVSLATAREEALNARRLIKAGIDPVADRRKLRINDATNTFQAIAQEWIASQSNKWSPTYVETVKSSLAGNLYPRIGGLPLRSIDVQTLRNALLIIEKRGTLVALRKVRMWASGIFRYAIATGRAESDPAAPLRGTFQSHKPRNFAALTKPTDFGELVRRVRSYDGSIITRCGLLLMAYTFTRTIELRAAKWTEFDLDKATWKIPAERMKMGEEHIVPLSRQALTIINELKTLTSNSELLFPNENNAHKPMSHNTLLYALYRLGYHKRSTVHGFRSSASTLLNEELDFDADVIERQLAHRERNKVRAAYHRAQYLLQRREMMQAWADYIDELAANCVGAKAQ